MRRFYPTRYHTKKFRDNMKIALDWDYSKAHVHRKRSEKDYGFVNTIGWYSDYIKLVNKRKPKRCKTC